MASCFGIEQVKNLTSRNIFFDANVLLYLFGNTKNSFWENKYSAIYHVIHEFYKMYTNFITISEFINREERIAYISHINFYNLSEKEFSFKEYRNSEDGREMIESIYFSVQHDILNHFEVVGIHFTKDDLINFLRYDNLDFNDKAIEKICKENNFVLLTNDKDFADSDVSILTANPQLLQL